MGEFLYRSEVGKYRQAPYLWIKLDWNAVTPMRILITYCCSHPTRAGWCSCHQTVSPQSLKYFLSGPIQKKLLTCSRSVPRSGIDCGPHQHLCSIGKSLPTVATHIHPPRTAHEGCESSLSSYAPSQRFASSLLMNSHCYSPLVLQSCIIYSFNKHLLRDYCVPGTIMLKLPHFTGEEMELLNVRGMVQAGW